MSVEENVQKLLAINEELNNIIEHYETKYDISKSEVLAIYTTEQIIREPEVLDTALAKEKLQIAGYIVGGLVSFCGEGPPYHICIERREDTYYNYKPACMFMVISSSLPKVNNEIKDGFIRCNYYFRRKVKWGIIGKKDKFDEFCSERSKDQCLIRRFPSKIIPASKEEIVNKFKEMLKRRNNVYAKYGRKIFKHIDPLIREASDMAAGEFLKNLLGLEERIEDKHHYRV